jgi:hypothetical protein
MRCVILASQKVGAKRRLVELLRTSFFMLDFTICAAHNDRTTGQKGAAVRPVERAE